jgi:hypothetical protein
MLRKIFRWRNFFLALAALIVGFVANFTYRLNNVCEQGDHIIQSEDDAIKQAQMRIGKARFYYPHERPGYIDTKPHVADFSRSRIDCCSAVKTRSILGVIIWKVNLSGGETIGEPKKREVGARMELSNCGLVSTDSYVWADPPK